MHAQHACTVCTLLQLVNDCSCLFIFSLPNVTQLHPPSTRSQTSYQEFSGCLSGSGSWSKLMAEQQSSLQCETYPPIYHTDCRHDVVAGECAATHPTYISTFFFSSFLSFYPVFPPLYSFISSRTHPSMTIFLPFLFLVVHPPQTFQLFVSYFFFSCPGILPLQKKRHTQFTKNATCQWHMTWHSYNNQSCSI